MVWTAGMFRLSILGVLVCGCMLEAAENLALGHAVVFAPKPNYRLTRKGDTDAMDLTDGRLTGRDDKALWFESRCVGYSYPGLANLAVDLGEAKSIGTVEIRFQGGSPQAGISTPGWIDVVVSQDGATYRKIAGYSRWNPGDDTRFKVPAEKGKAWVHPFRFANLNVRARYVGISFYGAGMAVMDELRVLKGKGPGRLPTGPAVAFRVTAPQLYFHKPVIEVLENLSTPLPIGLILPDPWKESKAAVELDFPPGIVVGAGQLGGVPVADATLVTTADGRKRYRFDVTLTQARKSWGRLYWEAREALEPDAVVKTRWIRNGHPGPWVSQSVRRSSIPPTPAPKELLTGMGWWSLNQTRMWPDALQVFHHLGFTTVPVFAHWLGQDAERQANLDFLAKARAAGFRIVNVDSPLHRMLSKHRNEAELYAQLPGGKHGTKFCPSYRGRFYAEEIQRVARETAVVGASYLTCDIELWGWAGPKDCEKCSRCQASYAASGAPDWAEWRRRQGQEMWRDLDGAVRAAIAQAHERDPALPRHIDMGGYNFRPGEVYQNIWPFDRLYPTRMNCSQVSTYTPLHPYHLALIGDRVRHDALALKRSDVLPWLTPGDAGTFPADAFTFVLLECFANGARGTYFWSGRVWDAETLRGYARAIRVAAAAEDIILKGKPITKVTRSPSGRLSGMRREDDFFLLPANYVSPVARDVVITLPPGPGAVVHQAETGAVLARLTPRQRTCRISIPAGAALPLLIREE